MLAQIIDGTPEASALRSDIALARQGWYDTNLDAKPSPDDIGALWARINKANAPAPPARAAFMSIMEDGGT